MWDVALFEESCPWEAVTSHVDHSLLCFAFLSSFGAADESEQSDDAVAAGLATLDHNLRRLLAPHTHAGALLCVVGGGDVREVVALRQDKHRMGAGRNGGRDLALAAAVEKARTTLAFLHCV